jgi:hypothetical protein
MSAVMPNPKQALLDSLAHQHPGGAAVAARLQTLVFAIYAATLLCAAVLLFSLPSQLPAAPRPVDVGVAVAFLCTLVVAVCAGWFHHRGQTIAATRWFNKHATEENLLWHVALSPEVPVVVRQQVAKLLDQSSPTWRLTAAQQSAPPAPVAPAVSLLALSRQTATPANKWMALSLALGLMLAGWALVVDERILLWLCLAAVLGIGYVMDSRSAADQSRLDAAILTSFSVEDLGMLVALGQTRTQVTAKTEGAIAANVLSRVRPGWSLSASQPLWHAVCACS